MVTHEDVYNADNPEGPGIYNYRMPVSLGRIVSIKSATFAEVHWYLVRPMAYDGLWEPWFTAEETGKSERYTNEMLRDEILGIKVLKESGTEKDGFSLHLGTLAALNTIKAGERLLAGC